MRRLVALALGLASSGALLLVAELRLRADEHALIYLWDSERRFSTRPGFGGTNAEGFHERALPPRAPPPAAGSRRVVVLGDSTTWGTGTPQEAWPAVVQGLLGDGWEVWNLSHYGYDVAQSAAVLREVGWRLAPDVVVYASYTNDANPTRYIEVGGAPAWVAREGLLPGALRRRSALVRRAEGALLSRTVDETPDWAFYRAGLGAIAADVAAHGAALRLVGLVPWVLVEADLAACSARLGAPGRCEAHAAIAQEQVRVAEALGLASVPVLPAWRAAGVDLAPPNRSDWQHAGRAGHAVIAGVAAGVLRAWDDVRGSGTEDP